MSSTVTVHVTREERALALFEERGHQIGMISPDTFEVPSGSLDGKSYTVHYGVPTPEDEGCTCPDWIFHGDEGPCKHLIATGILHAARRSGVREIRTPDVISGDPFKWAGQQLEEARRGFRERRTEAELVEAVAEEEDRLGRELSYRERVAFAYGYFAPSYTSEIQVLAGLDLLGGSDDE